MKKKSISIIILIAIISTVMIVNSAWAGSPQSHLWEGVAIGIGAAVIGSVLYHNHQNTVYSRNNSYRESKRHHFPPKPHRHSGYWEIRKEWVPPTYREVWNPGHYDNRGEWVDGRWIRIVDEPGYWTQSRVWVAGR